MSLADPPATSSAPPTVPPTSSTAPRSASRRAKRCPTTARPADSLHTSRAAVDPSFPATTPARERVIALEGVHFYYGAFRAVKDVDIAFEPKRITALIGPSGCGKSTLLRTINRMNDLIPGTRVEGRILYHGEDLYAQGRRPGRGPPADRHGVPEAQPVPQVDLRQRGVRAEDQRLQGQHGRARRGSPPARGDLGRRQGQAQAVRAGALGRPAAAAVHRAGDRDQPGRDPHGRALLGARPAVHAADRGADVGAASRTTRSSSSPTTCSRRHEPRTRRCS